MCVYLYLYTGMHIRIYAVCVYVHCLSWSSVASVGQIWGKMLAFADLGWNVSHRHVSWDC